MDISFNEDQKAIVDQAKRFLESECPSDCVREMYEDERGFSDGLWSKMAEMGWMGMRIPEAYSGVGLTMTDLCILLEEMGRVVLPGPFFSTVVLFAECLMAAGSESQKEAYLPKIASGALRGTLALLEPDGGPIPDYIRMEARPMGDNFILDGRKLFVLDAHVSDIMVVAARTNTDSDPDAITLFLVNTKDPGIIITPLTTMDGSRKQFEVRFENTTISKNSILGEVGNGRLSLSRVLNLARIGLSAENVGGAQKALEIAVDYAKMRVAFGQPIGSYQAIKHMCAQMLVEVEGARSLLHYAAWAQDEENQEAASLAASAIKSKSAEAYTKICADCIQIMGAIGYTWEHDAHLYYKRAKANEVALGDTIFHREKMARLIINNGK
jgi:alkylation response protein AidB-like acyl-CoA dehydrogenase